MLIPGAMAVLQEGNDFPWAQPAGEARPCALSSGPQETSVWEDVGVSKSTPKAWWWAEEPLIFPAIITQTCLLSALRKQSFV